MKNNKMWLERNIERLRRDIPTDFLEESEAKSLLSIAHKMKLPVHELKLFEDCEKVILYLETEPEIICYEIISSEVFTHREILGSLFSHQIESHTFGDIIIMDQHAYFVIKKELESYFIHFFQEIGRTKIKLKEVDRDKFSHYVYPYEEIKIIIPSMRLDNILSKLCKTSRKIVQKKLNDDEIRINSEIINKPSFLLNDGDTISIRRVGKFRYQGVLGETKKQNCVLLFYHYLS